MAEEIELKLALGVIGPPALRSHSLFADVIPQCLHLCNTYFDTPGGELQAAGMALRLRHDGKSYRQTLKTRGHSQGGLSSRGEWEWEVPGPTLDLDGLAALPALSNISSEQFRQLGPVFTTDFQREMWLLKSPRAHIEVALDVGEIRTGGEIRARQDLAQDKVTIRELELELKSGDPGALLDLAQCLAEQVAMRPSDTSKAARGHALCGQPWQLPPQDRPLQRALAALDALADTENPAWLEQARQALMVLADSADISVSQPARVLANALGNDGWNIRCGQQALHLARHLTPSPVS